METSMSRLLLRALQDSSVRETTGDADHPTIMEYFRTAGHSWVPHDEWAWCAAAMCHWVKSVGGVIPEKYTLRARSWLSLDEFDGYEKIEQLNLTIGDIVILWRRGRTSAFGHVALYTDASNSGSMQLYGGNQSDGNRLTKYPGYRFLGARRLLQWTI